MKAKKRNGADQEYEVLLAMSSFMSLTIGETDRTDLDALIAELEPQTNS